MKRLFIMAFAAFALVSCSKESTVDPLPEPDPIVVVEPTPEPEPEPEPFAFPEWLGRYEADVTDSSNPSIFEGDYILLEEGYYTDWQGNQTGLQRAELRLYTGLDAPVIDEGLFFAIFEQTELTGETKTYLIFLLQETRDNFEPFGASVLFSVELNEVGIIPLDFEQCIPAEILGTGSGSSSCFRGFVYDAQMKLID